MTVATASDAIGRLSAGYGGINEAALAQLGERQTEDLKVPGSIPGGGIFGSHHFTGDLTCYATI